MQNNSCLCAMLIILVFMGCKPTTQTQQTLPDLIPKQENLRFTGSEKDWPPSPLEAHDLRVVEWKPIYDGLSSDSVSMFRKIAEQNTQIQKLLGSRFGFIYADRLLPGKESDPLPSGEILTTFYSYTHNYAINAYFRDSRLTQLDSLPGYQPIESTEEVLYAARLASKDKNLQAQIDGLHVDGIITEIVDGKGAGNRVYYLAWSKSDTDDFPLYYAVVDLTTEVLLEAGPVQ